MELLPGTVIQQKYKIISNLGQGSTSIVYHAQDVDLDKEVALKFLRPELATYPSRRKRFWHEAQIAARFLHPSVMPVRAIGEWQNTLYLVMDYHPGQTLRTLLKQRSLTLSEARSLADQMLTCLADAHKVGLVHGDIKPANLMIKEDNQLLKLSIVDFGLASTTEETPSKGGSGTLNYMAPEVLLGAPPSQKSDLYSAALCIYQMLTNSLPIQNTSENPLASVLNYNPVPPSRHRRIPHLLDQVMAKALHQDIANRYTSAEEFKTALETAWTSSYSWSRYQILAGFFLFVVLIAIISFGWSYYKQQQYDMQFQTATQALEDHKFSLAREWAMVWRYEKPEARELVWKSLWYEFIWLTNKPEQEMQTFLQDTIWQDPEFIVLHSYLQFYNTHYHVTRDLRQQNYTRAIDRCSQFSGLSSHQQIFQKISKRMSARAYARNP